MPELKKTIATRKKWLIFSHILPHTAHVQSSVPQKGRADRISVKTKNLSLKYSQKGVENRISDSKLSTNDKPQVPQQSLLEGGNLLCWSRHGRSKNWCGGVFVCLFCPPIKCFLIKTTLRKSQQGSSERGPQNQVYRREEVLPLHIAELRSRIFQVFIEFKKLMSQVA